MSHPSDNTFDVHLIWQNIVHRPRLWVLPTVAVTLLALGYAIVRQPTWPASQALLMRDEAVGSVVAPGRFASVDEMQTAQETVLELAKSPAVVRDALAQLDPPQGRPADRWPTADDVEQVQDSIAVKAPQGAEFGRTEVFYLVVKHHHRPRAIALNRAICDTLERRLSQLRDAKAQSLIDELQKTVDVAAGDLHRATGRLTAMESDLGSDLAELRSLNEVGSGESNLRQSINHLRNELRQEKSSRLANEQLLDLLGDAQGDTEKLVATPSRLLQSQPALRRLKDGLVDAQLRTSRALGMMSLDHPKVQAAVAEEQDIRRRLHGELEVAIRGLQVELEMNDGRIAALDAQLTDAQSRMDKLAGLRAAYHNLSAEVQQRTEVWNKAQKDLADATAKQAAAHSASLLTRLDGPQTAAHPAGPSRATIVIAGAAGGLLGGLALVVLFAVPVAPPAEATSEHETESAHRAEREEKSAQPARPTSRRSNTSGSGLSLKEALSQLTLGEPVAAGM